MPWGAHQSWVGVSVQWAHRRREHWGPQVQMIWWGEPERSGTFSQRSPIVWKSRGQGRDACRLVRHSSPRFEPHPLSSFRSRSRDRPSAHFRSQKYSKPRQSITITASCWVIAHLGSAARRVHRHRYPVGNNRSPALRVGQLVREPRPTKLISLLMQDVVIERALKVGGDLGLWGDFGA
jgi:hypothetical protein